MKLYKGNYLFLFGLVLCVVFFAAQQGVFAHGDEDDSKHHTIEHALHDSIGQSSQYTEEQRKLEANRAEQARLLKQLEEVQSRELSLQNQITYYETNINIITLQIAETNAVITELIAHLDLLESDIETLQIKAGILNESIGSLQGSYFARVRSSYTNRFVPKVAVFLGSEDVQTAVLMMAYLDNVQQEDKKFLSQLRDTKDEYTKRTEELKQLKTEEEELKIEKEEQGVLLGQQRASLAKQQEEKQYLLGVTNNEEAEYQKLLAISRAEQAAIERAIAEILQRVDDGAAITAGTPIGRQGNTGYVFPRPFQYDYCGAECGTHLHFMILTCNTLSCSTNPTPYLYNGQYATPFTSWKVTQAYGPTTFSNFHNGIDIQENSGVYGNNGHGAPVRAIADGKVTYGTDSLGGKYAIIKHTDNFYSAYWHLQ